jgi:hypothetical protein
VIQHSVQVLIQIKNQTSVGMDRRLNVWKRKPIDSAGPSKANRLYILLNGDVPVGLRKILLRMIHGAVSFTLDYVEARPRYEEQPLLIIR